MQLFENVLMCLLELGRQSVSLEYSVIGKDQVFNIVCSIFLLMSKIWQIAFWENVTKGIK